MPKYQFEIQSLAEVNVEADNQEDARMILVESTRLWEDDLIRNASISNGREVKQEGTKDA
jgi:hypothetical protein